MKILMKNMPSETVKLSTGKGKYKVHLIGIPTEYGLIITILGGEKPHVGAVAVGVPRPSLKDPSKLSATSSVFTLSSHKDDEIAKPMAEKIAKKLNQTTVVVAGVHVEKASKLEIRELLTNAKKAGNEFIRRFSKFGQ